MNPIPGVLVNTPLAPCVALGAKRIIPVLVTSEHNPPVSVESMTLGAARDWLEAGPRIETTGREARVTS